MKIVKEIAILILLIVSLLVSPCSAQLVDNTQIIGASPGDVITFHGHGTPCSTVTIDITTTVYIATHMANGQRAYDLSLCNVKIPCSQNRFSITASPVSTMTVWGSYHGIKISQDVGVVGSSGSFSVSNVPATTYTIGVNGLANGSKVRLDVHATSGYKVDKNGNYTATVCTGGFPAGVYSVTQDGSPIAIVYLGVPVPAQPTPIPSPSPSPCPTKSSTPPSCPQSIRMMGDAAPTVTPSPTPADNAVPPTLVDVQVSTLPPESSPPAVNTLYDNDVGIGAVLAALAACSLCGAGAYILLFRKK